MHSGPFGCLTKLGAKRAELVQKFVPLSCVRIFRNERTGSTPLDPKLTFWCVSYYLGAFGTVWLPYETRCKRGRASACSCHELASEFFATNTPNPPHWTLNSFFGASRSVWVYLAIFCYYTKLGANRVELVQLMQKFVPWRRIRIFRTEHTQSTPLDPKLIFWCVS